jgi:hypothetical protein
MAAIGDFFAASSIGPARNKLSAECISLRWQNRSACGENGLASWPLFMSSSLWRSAGWSSEATGDEMRQVLANFFALAGES